MNEEEEVHLKKGVKRSTWCGIKFQDAPGIQWDTHPYDATCEDCIDAMYEAIVKTIREA